MVLIIIEALALSFVAAASIRLQLVPTGIAKRRTVLLVVLVSSPYWTGLLYLLPVPASLWAMLPGRATYVDLLQSSSLPVAAWLPASLVPDATRASVLSAIPLTAAFVGGFLANLTQIRTFLTAVFILGIAEVLLGLVQTVSGATSPLNFGAVSARPIGTFANTNHLANYLGMSLTALICLTFMNRGEPLRGPSRQARWSQHMLTLTVAGALVLLIGILMTRSRGALIATVPVAICALFVTQIRRGRVQGWRSLTVLAILALCLGVFVVGYEAALARFEAGALTGGVLGRTILAVSALGGAAEFWPFGAGWGTFEYVYPRFQPPQVVGLVYHAHHDYVEMIFEGGMFAVILMLIFSWLALTQGINLAQAIRQHGRLRREEMASAICGIGLFGFLLHSLVEFNMHIPANAIVACLFAGIFLRPLAPKEAEPPGD